MSNWRSAPGITRIPEAESSVFQSPPSLRQGPRKSPGRSRPSHFDSIHDLRKVRENALQLTELVGGLPSLI